MTLKLSRRRLLRGAAGAALALPLLSDVRPKDAQAAPFPKRFIVLFSPNGTIPSAWLGSGSGPSFQPGSIMSQSVTPMAESLLAHKDDLIVVQNLQMTAALNGPGGDAHGLGMGCLLTATEVLAGDQFKAGMGGPGSGWPGGISIDQHIAEAVGKDTKFSSLEFSVKRMEGSIWSRMSYKGAGLPVTPEDNPSAAFDRIFGDFDAEPEALERLRARRKSVLDEVNGEFGVLVSELSGSDKAKVEAHLDALRDLESHVTTVPSGLGAACFKPTAPTLTSSESVMYNDSGMEVINAQADVDVPDRHEVIRSLLVPALACDLTRVASIIMAPSRSDIVLNWIGIPDSHHDLSHAGDGDTGAQDKLVKINQWYGEQVAALITELKAVKEGDGTLFDNTVILWCNELGVGNAHSHDKIPFMLAGSAGGYLKTGQAVSYPDGTPHNGLLISLCHAMGLGDTQTFGNPAYCNGPLPNLTA